jgi:hypothetical protein
MCPWLVSRTTGLGVLCGPKALPWAHPQAFPLAATSGLSQTIQAINLATGIVVWQFDLNSEWLLI